jgi:hypothetical protein
VAPNKGVELTAYSVRSSLAPASSRSSRLALGVRTVPRESRVVSRAAVCRVPLPHGAASGRCALQSCQGVGARGIRGSALHTAGAASAGGVVGGSGARPSAVRFPDRLQSGCGACSQRSSRPTKHSSGRADARR